MEIAFLLVLLVLATILFAVDRFPVELITGSILILLTLSGILEPQEAFAGFGSDFIIMLISVFVLSASLQQSGVLDYAGAALLRLARLNPGMLVTLVMVSVALTSAFMNNTTVTAVFMAPVISLARKLNLSPSRLLIPVAFASIMGGTCTVIGTSTNLAVNGYLNQAGIQPFSMFEFSLIGITLCITGIAYMVLVGRHFLPNHKSQDLAEEYHLREYISEIVIMPGSKLIRKRIDESELSKKGFLIQNIIRNNENFLAEPTTILLEGDILIVEGNIENLLRVKEESGIEIRADAIVDKDMVSRNIRLAEVMVTPGSDLLNQSIKECRFRQRYGLVVIAINRTGQTISEKIGDVILRTGDILLVQGRSDNISYHRTQRDLVVLQEFQPGKYKRRNIVLTLLSFAAAVLISSLGWINPSVAFMTACFITVAFRCIQIEKAWESIEWRLIMLIGGMSAFGTAMVQTGAANFLAGQIIHLVGDLGPMGILAGFIALTVFLTQPMSNAAAALVILPVAIESAGLLDINPRSMAAAVMLSASISLITPYEPSCILVYGPGQYKFSDFLKAGVILTLIMMFLILFLVPRFFPL